MSTDSSLLSSILPEIQTAFNSFGAFFVIHFGNRPWALACDIYLHAEDSDSGCRNVMLACTRGDDEHVGMDVHEHLDLLMEGCRSWTLMEKLVRFLTCNVRDTMFCLAHGRHCRFLEVDVDNSGFPCVDWSPSGLQLGVFGPTFTVPLTLCAWHRSRRTKIVFMENVPEFEVSVLEHLMGDLFTIHVFYLEPADVGREDLSRMRLLVMMLLKGALVMLRVV